MIIIIKIFQTRQVTNNKAKIRSPSTIDENKSENYN